MVAMEEFHVRSAPNSSNKKYNVFKLHKDDNVSWSDAKMRRENDYQPWQIKFGSGRTGRRFKAIKEGGVGDNASYFVFYKPKDRSDTYEVCSVDEWYNVSATQRYKTLTAEEAEQKFEQRHKMLNLFSVMHMKKGGGENGEEPGGSSDYKAFKVSELDDWDESGGDDGSGDDEGSDGAAKKARRKKAGKKEKEDADDAPDEAKEESDEGDFEQREVDYMSDSSSESSDSEKGDNDTDVKGIAEEEALRDLLSTDDEEDSENHQQKSSKLSSSKALGTVEFKQDPEPNGSDDSSDSDDYDVDDEKMDSMFMKKSLPANLTMVKQETKPDLETSSANNNRQQAANNKRRLDTNVPQPQPSKRYCLAEPPSSPANGQEKIVEDLIRKYLSRKPMTLKTLLKDIKSKLKRMDGVTPEMDNDLVNTIASIIKRLQPDKQKINEVTYLSLKS